MDKTIIGKFYKLNCSIQMIVGYDFCSNSYISKNIEYIDFYGYNKVQERELHSLMSKHGMIKQLESEINQNQSIAINIIKQKEKELIEAGIENRKLQAGFKSMDCLYEYLQVFKRLRQTNSYIKDLNRYKDSREIQKAKKGMRRVKKRLYHYLGKEDYYTVIRFLEDNNYPDLDKLKLKIQKEQEKIEILKNIKEVQF